MNRSIRGLLVAVLLCAAGLPAAAQTTQQDTLRARPGDTLQLSRKNLVPFSEQIFVGDSLLARRAYELDYYAGRLLLRDSSLAGLALRVTYRVFGDEARIQRRLRRRDTMRSDTTDSLGRKRIFHRERARREKPGALQDLSMGSLRSSGSLSRSITVGTNRDLAVNSDFRLQLDGEIGDGIQIVGAITDQNIPVQPSGSSQQISDFDRIFIRLSKDPFRLTFGDYEVAQSGTHFANLYRNVLGAKAGYRGTNVEGWASFSVAKGQFQTNAFSGENNKQGPYRLTGENGEQFIIVLAGSEKVYVNGKRMQRGESQDYIMDYNTGELTFTTNQMITNNDRIVVDFEYTQRNYTRSLIFSQVRSKLADDKLDLRFSYGRQADNPNAPIDIELQQEERQALREAGDNPSEARVPGVDTVDFDPDEVLYRATDTVVNGRRYEDVFVYSQDSARAQFRLQFERVGDGKGNYIKANSLINGNIFKWVAPGPDGEPRGDFAPVRLLPLPQRLQVFSGSASYQLTKHLSVSSELNLSGRDRNRLSPQGDDDNNDLATRNSLQFKEVPLAGSGWELGGSTAFQYVGRRYQNFDRVYQKEYGRQWNFNNQRGRRGIERLGEGALQLSLPGKYQLRFSGGYRSMSDSLTTTRGVFQFQGQDSSGLMGNYKFVALNTQIRARKSRSNWLRHNGDLYWLAGPHLKAGSEIWIEHKRDRRSDSLSFGSFEFYDITPYLKTYDWDRFGLALYLNYRLDYQYESAEYRKKSRVYAPRLKWRLTPSSNFEVRHSVTYRNFQLTDPVFRTDSLRSEATFLTNLQSDFSLPSRVFRGNMLYEALTERVARRQVNYVRVNTGQGQYEWIDYDDDETQDLDEFQRSTNPLQANFVKVLSPTADQIPALGIRFSSTLRSDFSQLFEPERKLSNLLAKAGRAFSTLTNFQYRQQSRLAQAGVLDYLITPQQGEADDSSRLASNLSLRQDIFFFRNDPQGELGFTWQENQNRQFLASGTERRQRRSVQTQQRWNFASNFSLENRYATGFNRNRAEVLQDRNYDIRFHRVNPKLNFQLNRRIRLAGGYELQRKVNHTVADTINSRLWSHMIAFESRINFKGRNNLNAKLELYRINQNGEPNNTANFEMLEGLRAGNNAVWNIFVTWYLTQNLEFSLTYDGRASAERPPVHSGQMQVRALF